MNRSKWNIRSAFKPLFALLMLLIFSKYVFQLPLPSAVLLLIMAAMVCIGDQQQIVATCIISIPLITVIPCSYVVLAAILVFAVKYPDSIRVDLAIVPVLLIVIWELLHDFSNDIDLKQLVSMFLPYLLCGFLMWQDLKKVDYGYCIRMMAITVAVLCQALITIVLIKSDFNIQLAFSNMNRLGIAAENEGDLALHINPNSLGVICALAASCLLQLSNTNQKKRGDLLMLIILLLFGVLTMSRTYLMLLIMIVALFAVAGKGGLRKSIRFVLMLPVIVTFLYLMLQMVFPGVLEAYMARFEVADISGGRLRLLEIYNAFILSSNKVLFFGVGLSDFGDKIANEMGLAYNVPHNCLQEIVIAWGIIGTVFCLWFFFEFIRHAKQKVGRLYLMNYIPMVLLIGKGMVGQLLSSDYSMLALALVYLSLCQNFYPVKELEDLPQEIPTGEPRT